MCTRGREGVLRVCIEGCIEGVCVCAVEQHVCQFIGA